jgi:hypothetical protein
MEHIRIEIKGKFTKYAELRADYDYCFYDIDDEEINYMTYIATPITDISELTRKYCVVQGNAQKLNEELRKAVQDDK